MKIVMVHSDSCSINIEQIAAIKDAGQKHDPLTGITEDHVRVFMKDNSRILIKASYLTFINTFHTALDEYNALSPD